MFDRAKIDAIIRKYQTGTDWEIPGGASAERIAEYERELGFALPDDFKAWVMLTNGPTIWTDTGHYYGVAGALNGAIDTEFEMIPAWREKRWIPICSDASGCYFAMATGGEFGKGYPILYFDIDKGFRKPTCIEASDLQHFLERQIEIAHRVRIHGIKSIREPNAAARKQRILENDPAILNFHGAPYRWEI